LPTPSLFGILLTGLIACNTDIEPAGCEAMAPGRDRDVCLHKALESQAPEAHDEVKRLAGLIDDRIVRSLAVSSWVQAHGNEIPHAVGLELCGLLEPSDKELCEHRFIAGHLQP
jgi:hypothetical protein